MRIPPSPPTHQVIDCQGVARKYPAVVDLAKNSTCVGVKYVDTCLSRAKFESIPRLNIRRSAYRRIPGDRMTRDCRMRCEHRPIALLALFDRAPRSGRFGACLSFDRRDKIGAITKTAGEWTMRISMPCTPILAYEVIGQPSPTVAQVDQYRAFGFSSTSGSSRESSTAAVR